jgi:hypothetical protein
MFTSGQVGDRVIAGVPFGAVRFLDKLGTIIKIRKDSILVEFDNNIEGHSGGCLGEDGHCWWLYANDFRLVPSEWDK